MSELEQRFDERVVLGIHTNTEPGDALADGHVWLTITQGGKTEAYGLWLAGHPRFSRETSPPATDIRGGLENGWKATASRYYELTPDQLTAFEAATREKVTWGYANTCASWASDTAFGVTGERVNASELAGLTDTPRQMRESIDQLESQRSTSRDAPRAPTNAAPERGSSSSSFSTTNASDYPVHQLLAAAADPERLRVAIEELQSSARGQAFASDSAAHASTLSGAEQARSVSEPTLGDVARGPA